MITFRQYLAEDEKDLVEFLRVNCSDAILDMDKAGKFLWRGTKSDKSEHTFKYDDKSFEGFYGFPRSDRKPRDTPAWAHDYFNEFFEKEFGEPLRSTTVFCYSSRVRASAYGKPYALIPIGSYSIVWSENVQDLSTLLFPDVEEKDDENEPDSKAVAGGALHWIATMKMKVADVTREMEKETIDGTFRHARYQETKIDSDFENQNELMLRCKSYLMLKIPESEFVNLVRKVAKVIRKSKKK